MFCTMWDFIRLRIKTQFVTVSGPCLFVLLAFSNADLIADDSPNVELGKAFLSDSRLQRWKEVFEKGIPSFGKITSKYGTRTLSECWLDDEYFWIKTIDTKGISTIFIGNPQYSATIREVKAGVYRILHVGGTVDVFRYVPIEAVLFAQSSSVGLSRQMIPDMLRQGEMLIRGYRKEGDLHIVTLGFSDLQKSGEIELRFDEALESLLPVENRFKLEDNDDGHLAFHSFEKIGEYSIPLRMASIVPKFELELETVVEPEIRLNFESCFLSYYSLPEPKNDSITEFGRDANYWRPLLVVAIVVGVVMFILVRRKVKAGD